MLYSYSKDHSKNKKRKDHPKKFFLYIHCERVIQGESLLLPWDSITRGDSFASERPIFYICERVRASILFLFCFLRCSAPLRKQGGMGGDRGNIDLTLSMTIDSLWHAKKEDL